MYEDIYDAKTAVEHLSGFNVANRYLIVLYYNTAKQNKKVPLLRLYALLHCYGVVLAKLAASACIHMHNLLLCMVSGIAVMQSVR